MLVIVFLSLLVTHHVLHLSMQVTLLCQGSLDSTSNNSLAVTISIIKVKVLAKYRALVQFFVHLFNFYASNTIMIFRLQSLIGHFDLDPNRVFDIVSHQNR